MDWTPLWDSLVTNFPVAALALYLYYREMQHAVAREKTNAQEREEMLKQQVARERQVADKAMHREDLLLAALNGNTAALVELKAAIKENGYNNKKAA